MEITNIKFCFKPHQWLLGISVFRYKAINYRIILYLLPMLSFTVHVKLTYKIKKYLK